MKSRIKVTALLTVATLVVFTGMAQEEGTETKPAAVQTQVGEQQTAQQSQRAQERKQLRDATGPNHPANRADSNGPQGGDQKRVQNSKGKASDVKGPQSGKGNNPRFSGPGQQRGTGSTSQMGQHRNRRGGGRGSN